MMKIRNWFIKILGGVTKEQEEITRLNHENWAVKYLTGKNGEVTPDCSIYNPFDDDVICVIRSKISILDGRVKEIKVAPWCRESEFSRLNVTGND